MAGWFNTGWFSYGWWGTSPGPPGLKARDDLAVASIGSVNGLAIGSVKSIDGMAQLQEEVTWSERELKKAA